jgi:hypothetical protein
MVTPLTGDLRAMVPVGVAAARTLDRPVVGIAATPDGGVGATFPSERRILALTQVHRVLLLSLEFAPNEHVNGALKKEQEFIPARDASPPRHGHAATPPRGHPPGDRRRGTSCTDGLCESGCDQLRETRTPGPVIEGLSGGDKSANCLDGRSARCESINGFTTGTNFDVADEP